MSSQKEVSITSPFDPSNWEPAELIKPEKKKTLSDEYVSITKTVLEQSPLNTAKVDTNCSTAATFQHTATRMSTAYLPSPNSKPAVDTFSLSLSEEIVKKLKQNFISRLKIEGRFVMKQAELAAISDIEQYRDGLQRKIRECGHALDMLIGSRFVPISEAKKAIEQCVSLGIITTEEVILSADCEQIVNCDGLYDVISIHSLANVVRKILNERE